MKYLFVMIILLLTTAFVKSAVSEVAVKNLVPKKLSCLMGESQVSEQDYNMDALIQKTDFFSQVAIQAISQIIKNKPYDQKGTEFNFRFFEGLPKLSGYLVIKESYQQIDLNTAKCEDIIGNNEGFSLACIMKSPIDNQDLFLNYLYKYKTKMGVFNLKVSKSKIGLLTKNIFACMNPTIRY